MAGKNRQIIIDPMKLTRNSIVYVATAIKGKQRFESHNGLQPEAVKKAEEESDKHTVHSEKNLDSLVEKTESVLFKTKNILPILASEIVIDTAKVTIIHRPFFFSESINSVTIKNITEVSIQTAPFLATMRITDVNFRDNRYQVRWIWKRNAEKARRIITGLMQAAKEGIDLKSVESDNVASKLEEIGKIRQTQTTVSAD